MNFKKTSLSWCELTNFKWYAFKRSIRSKKLNINLFMIRKYWESYEDSPRSIPYIIMLWRWIKLVWLKVPTFIKIKFEFWRCLSLLTLDNGFFSRDNIRIKCQKNCVCWNNHEYSNWGWDSKSKNSTQTGTKGCPRHCSCTSKILNRFFLKTLFLKSLDTISQKFKSYVMHWSYWYFAHFSSVIGA